MGEAWEVATEGGDVSICLGKGLSRITSVGAVVWSRDVGAIGAM